MKSRILSTSILAAALLCGAGAHAERVWNYTSYTSEGVAFPGGTFKLSDVAADGSATVTVVTGDRLPWICLYGRTPARIDETEAVTEILIPPKVGGCPTRRYSIYKDGSGGFLDTLRADGSWSRSPRNLDLTPKR